MRAPRVSVVIPTFRRPDLLPRAVQSVLSQDMKDFEIIIVNDDQAAPVELAFSDPRIRIVQNDRAKGACGARNTGLYLAAGHFVTGLDDDDEFTPDRLSCLLAAYDARFAFVSSGMYLQAGATRIRKFRLGRSISYRDLLWGNCVGSQVFTETYKITSIGGFDEQLSSAQDWEMWLRLVGRWGEGIRISRPLYVQRMDHSHQRISTGEKKIEGLQRQYSIYEREMTASQRAVRLIQLQRYSGGGVNWRCLLENPRAAVYYIRSFFDLN